MPIIIRISLIKTDTKNGSSCISDMIRSNQRPTPMLNGLIPQINKLLITRIIISLQNSLFLLERISSSQVIVGKWLLLNLILEMEPILRTINLLKHLKMYLVSIREWIIYSRKMTRLNLDKQSRMFSLTVLSKRNQL